MKPKTLISCTPTLLLLATLISSQLGLVGDARAQVNLVSNGSFTANAASFGTWPGYTGGANPANITGWNNVFGGGVGVNGAAVSFASPNPFGPANAGGNTYAFIQGGTGELSQNLSLAANRTYKLEFDAATRSGNIATFRVQIADNSQVYVTSGDVNGNTAAFNHYIYTFTTPGTFNGTPSIQLYNLTSGDNTVDFANVSVSRNLIRFDDVAGDTVINTYYPGVTFTNPVGGNIYAHVDLYAPSPTNVVSIYPSTLRFDPAFNAFDGAVDAHFSTLMREVKIDVRPQTGAAPLTPPTNRPFLQAFDSTHTFLGTVYYSGPLPTFGIGTNQTLTFTSPTANIAYARFSVQNPGTNSVPMFGVFDNFGYDDGSYLLTINTVGSGLVVISPYQASYSYGTVVSLTAAASLGWSFSSWSGATNTTANPLSITMKADTTLTATFVPTPQAGPNFIVTTTDDHDDGVAGVFDCTLREAINASNANADTNTITFGPGVVGQITLKLGQLTISHDVTITGPGAKTLAITVSNISSSFQISGGAVAAVSGLSIGNVVVGFNSYVGMTIDAGSSLSLAACSVSGFRNTGIFNGGTLNLNNCTIAGNTGDNGGGISNYGLLGVTNSTISGNGASSAGGIYNHPTGTLTLISSTVHSNYIINSFLGGGGVRNNSGAATVRNSIIAGNTNIGAVTGIDCIGAFASLGYNLIGKTNDSSGFNGANQDQMGSIASPLNPLLGPLADNGGETFTHKPLSGSTAIDKGNSSGLITDQRGRLRPYDFPSLANATGGDGSDIGAYEINPPVLNIAKSSSNVVLSWSTNEAGYTLESTPQLTPPPSWTTVPGTPVIVSGQYTVTTNTVAGKQFYRLRNP